MCVDPFIADVNPSEHAQWAPGRKQVVPQKVRVGDLGVAVKTQRGTWTAILLQLVKEGFLVPFVVEVKLRHEDKNNPDSTVGIASNTNSCWSAVWREHPFKIS